MVRPVNGEIVSTVVFSLTFSPREAGGAVAAGRPYLLFLLALVGGGASSCSSRNCGALGGCCAGCLHRRWRGDFCWRPPGRVPPTMWKKRAAPPRPRPLPMSPGPLPPRTARCSTATSPTGFWRGPAMANRQPRHSWHFRGRGPRPHSTGFHAPPMRAGPGKRILKPNRVKSSPAQCAPCAVANPPGGLRPGCLKRLPPRAQPKRRALPR